MAILRMLIRAAFICNLCFLLAIFMLLFKHPVNPGAASLILVMGFFLSIVLNIAVNVSLFCSGWLRKDLKKFPAC